MSLSLRDAPAGRAGGLASVDVAVLAGGLGTRLRPVVGDTPKILAPVAGRPFLDHLLVWLRGFGARRVVLCLGVGSTAVLDHLATAPFPDLDIVPSIEKEPLGTAGALRLAAPLLSSDPVLVMNGDTFVDADLNAAVETHRASGAAASVLCVTVPSMARYGRMDIDRDGLIRRFTEKDPADTGPGAINAGIYLFSHSWLTRFARGTGASLERDVFAAARPGSFQAILAPEATFIDIGTPESFAAADTVIVRALDRHRNPPARTARA